MIVRVHRWPIKTKDKKHTERTREPLETRQLHARLVHGGIDVSFPLAGVYTFNKGNGVGRGNLRDWIIDKDDHRKLMSGKP